MGKEPNQIWTDKGSGIEFEQWPRDILLWQRNWPERVMRTVPTWVPFPGSVDGYSRGLGLKMKM